MKIVDMVFLAIIGLLVAGLIADCAEGKTITLDKDMVVLRGEVGDDSISSTIRAISKVKGKKVLMYITSPGGSVIAGDRFIEFMKTSGKKFTCIADFAASMAISIFQQCDNRYVMTNGILMQHVASWGVNGQDPNNRALIKLIDALLSKLERGTSKAMRMGVAKYKKLIRDDIWMYGKVALRFNAADKVVQVKCSPELYRKRVKITQDTMFGSYDAIFSGCPLISSPIGATGQVQTHSKSSWSNTYIKKINKLGEIQ